MRRHAKASAFRSPPATPLRMASLLAVLAMLLLPGCGSEPSENPDSTDRPVAQQPAAQPRAPRIRALDEPVVDPPGNDAPVVEVDYHELVEEFSDAQAAIEKYEDQWVEVTATVASVGSIMYLEIPGTHAPRVTLYDPEEAEVPILADFHCFMAEGEKPWEQASVGDTVTVRGLVGRASSRLRLVECHIVEGGAPTLFLSVDELAAMYEPDPAAFGEQNKYKQVIVYGKYLGEIPDPDIENPESWEWATIEGESGNRIYFAFTTNYQFHDLEIGEPCYVIGTVEVYQNTSKLGEILFQTEGITELMGDQP